MHFFMISYFLVLIIILIISQDTVREYIQGSGMDKTGVWGTDIELLTLAH